MSENPYKVLFLCTGNSCRSILAEAILNEVGKGRFIASSAGSQPAGYVHPHALACLNHNRIPVQQPHSKTWDEFADTELDLVVTVCDNARESCPVFPGKARVLPRPFDDPPRLARDAATEEEALAPYRRVRDEIRAFIAEIRDHLPGRP